MTDQELRRLASFYFGVTLPLSSTELKKAYRRRCLELHPDIGGDAASFKEMQNAHSQLTELGCVADVFADEIEFRDVQTIDGIPLAELGLGLDSTSNGTDCPDCGHKGYHEVRHRGLAECKSCEGTGMWRRRTSSRCRACNGTGKFTQARSRRVVDCRVCGGTGVYVYRVRSFHSPCLDCGGLGYIRNDTSKKSYMRCHRCGGFGELPMWNPVLPKSALSG